MATTVGHSDLVEVVPGNQIEPFVIENPTEIDRIRMITEEKFGNV